jgi:hypothetical protein
MSRLACSIVALTLAGACVVEQPVDLVVRGRSAAPDESAVTVRVVAGSCSGLAMPSMGTMVYDETAPLGETLPPVGALEDRSYAFSALFHTTTCRVSRFGCTEVNPLDVSPVVIDVTPVTIPTGCPTGEVCAEGICQSSEPPGDCASGAETCTTTGGTDGICCEDGSCASATDGCPGTTCGDTNRDVSNCGACGHRCPTDLGCAGGLCQAIPAPTSVHIEADPDGTTIVDGNARAVFLWQVPSVAGASDQTLLAVTDGGLFDPGTADGTGVPLPSVAVVPDTAWLDASGVVNDVAVASIVVVRNEGAAMEISLDTVTRAMSAPSPDFYGVVRELVVVASQDGVPREGAATTFLPEGAPAGVTLHRRNPDGITLLPTVDNTGRLQLCESTTEAVQRDCVMSLADPLGSN